MEQENTRQLKELLDSDKAELLAIYRRRRIGKTYLINEFFSSTKWERDQKKFQEFFNVKQELVKQFSLQRLLLRGIQKLEEMKIIKQINSNKRDKIYCATEILVILEEPTRISTYSP